MNPDEETINAAIDQLLRSERGRHALSTFLPWFGECAAGLDAQNQQAILTLLATAWGPRPMTTLEMIEAALRR